MPDTELEQNISPREDYAPTVRRVTMMSLSLNIVLTSFALIAGLLANSQALVADAVHSIADLLADLVAFVAVRFAAQPPDEGHPYGHGRIETLGTMTLSTLLIVTGTGIIVNAIEGFGRSEIPSSYGVIVALTGIFGKEALYQYTIRVGRRIRSQLLITNAWHHRSDAGSSVGALAGLVGAQLGYPILDPVAAALVGALIARMGFQVGRKCLQELLDSSLAVELLAAIRDEALKAPGALQVHRVRARRMGPNVLVDLHLEVPGKLRLLEAHSIAEAVEATILARFSEVSEVLIHLDPIELTNQERG